MVVLSVRRYDADYSRPVIDLDSYLARIGYRGERAPTLAVLNAISIAHVQSIPFENLDVVLGVPIDLDASAIERKLVHGRRGGYCFEQNGLLLEALTQLGFVARPLSARAVYQRPRDVAQARTHLIVRVDLEESWLVDVGFGGFSLTSALRLADREPQATPHEPRRIVPGNGVLVQQVRFADDWHDIYEFTLEEMPLIDRVVANWYTSTHPASHFRHRLIAARALPRGARLVMRNRELTHRKADGSAEHWVIRSPDELLAVLSERFGLGFAPGTRFQCDELAWDA